jgi:hypothetical protein
MDNASKATTAATARGKPCITDAILCPGSLPLRLRARKVRGPLLAEFAILFGYGGGMVLPREVEEANKINKLNNCLGKNGLIDLQGFSEYSPKRSSPRVKGAGALRK